MSDLPPEVEGYLKSSQRDPKKLDQYPQTKRAFKSLTKEQLAAIDMLKTLGKGLEAEGLEDMDAEGRLQMYIYAIH
jgi:hypothetical protein